MISATPDFKEALTMSDISPRLNLSALETPVNRTVSLIKFAVLAVSVAAAIPTAQNLYYAWKTGVPFNQVQYRLTQAALWEKNFDCKIDYRALSGSTGSRVEVGSCAKTGDISIKISDKGQTNYEWIAFDQLPKPSSQTAGLNLMDLIVSSAYAAELATGTVTSTAQPLVVAQAESDVLCQSKQKDTIVRVVKENGKCMRETVSMFKGSVEKREEVPCDKACPIAN